MVLVKATPILRWAGSKRKLLPKLIPYWGIGCMRYVEPFMGSAVLFYAINPPAALLSDLNGELIETFQQIKDQTKEVFECLHELPLGKESFYDIRSLDPKQLSSTKRAARFIFLNRFCFNGLYRTDRNGRFNVPYGDSKTGSIPSWEQFELSAERLASAVLCHGDFEELLYENVVADDFVYLDPPYAVANDRIFRQYGPQTFGLDDLARLHGVIKEIDRRGARFVLSYAHCPEVEKEFNGWAFQQVSCRRNISGFVKHRRVEQELIISNFEPQGLLQLSNSATQSGM